MKTNFLEKHKKASKETILIVGVHSQKKNHVLLFDLRNSNCHHSFVFPLVANGKEQKRNLQATMYYLIFSNLIVGANIKHPKKPKFHIKKKNEF
jgi:hypothetical protein